LSTKLVVFRQVKKYSGKFCSAPKLFLSPTAVDQLTSLLAQKEDSVPWRGHSNKQNKEYCLAKTNQPLEMLRIIRKWRDCKHHEVDLYSSVSRELGSRGQSY